MLDFLIHVLVTITLVGLGGILLLAGRRYLWILLGGGGLIITATVIAELQAYPDAWTVMRDLLWIPLLVSLAVGAIGIYIALKHEKLAVDLIGFGVGVLVATWFDEILLVLSGRSADDSTWWTGLLLIGAGLIGAWITRRDPDQAVILISVIVGVNTISNGLNLDKSKSVTAVIILSLALTGVVVQYAMYLREHPRLGRRVPPVPHPVSEELPY